MKTLLILVFLILTPVCVFPEMCGEASVGYDFAKELVVTKLELGYVFDIWEIETKLWVGTYNYMIFNKLLPAAMVRAIFPIGCRLSYNPIFIEAKHFCSHPYKWQYKFPHEGYFWQESGTLIRIGVEW